MRKSHRLLGDIDRSRLRVHGKFSIHEYMRLEHGHDFEEDNAQLPSRNDNQAGAHSGTTSKDPSDDDDLLASKCTVRHAKKREALSNANFLQDLKI